MSKSDDKKECVFCEMIASSKDEAHFILYRGKSNFVVLNKYPYVSGHLMIVPYRHLSTIEDFTPEETSEMMLLATIAVKALREQYQSQGFNLGMNIGKAAGAGIEEHAHLHVLPRWGGDTNFITVVGDMRIIPEDLKTTYAKLKPYFDVSV